MRLKRYPQQKSASNESVQPLYFYLFILYTWNADLQHKTKGIGCPLLGLLDHFHVKIEFNLGVGVGLCWGPVNVWVHL